MGGPHIMVVTPYPEDLQGFTRGGWNGTYTYICQAPINGFWLHQVIKLKPGEGGCDLCSRGRNISPAQARPIA
jgi:hypothetical protein